MSAFIIWTAVLIAVAIEATALMWHLRNEDRRDHDRRISAKALDRLNGRRR